jgi:predicted transcriptional regulator
MAMATQIVRKDAAVTVEIPEELLKEARLSVGDQVEWTLTPSGALALHASGGPPAADYEAWKQEEILAGLSELDAGDSVGGEKVSEWLRSWSSEHELPPPL